MLDLLPPPLDFDNHFSVEDTPLKQYTDSDDDSPLSHSIFEFSETELSFDDLSTDFAVRMHFWVRSHRISSIAINSRYIFASKYLVERAPTSTDQNYFSQMIQ